MFPEKHIVQFYIIIKIYHQKISKFNIFGEKFIKICVFFFPKNKICY